MKNRNEELLPYYELLSNRIYWMRGKPYWSKYVCNKAREGELAGRINAGYRQLGVTIESKTKRILAHRLKWFMKTGMLPENKIDHKDHDKDNNRDENLREATVCENGMNRNSAKNSSSKYLGVSWNKASKKWRSAITINGKSKTIGHFIYEEEAAKARDEEAKIHYKKFANLNFK